MNLPSLIQEIAILAPPFLLALTIHEYAHGLVALHFGDPTASRLGRLTLNPLKHIDPIGVLAFIIMKIGWAKPVPVDPRYFKNPVRDLLYVSLAGPGANLLTAVASGLALQILAHLSFLLPRFLLMPVLMMLAASVWINIMLAVFNLIPVPPLDGSKVLMGLLPPNLAAAYRKIEPFGFIILLALFYTGVISKVILPIITFANNLILG
jgi:Zn-dependent protease